MKSTPIYTEMITEAKRRTKRHSIERRRLVLLDENTRPSLEWSDRLSEMTQELNR